MRSLETIDQNVRDAVAQFLARVEPRFTIGEVWLYGSYARGEDHAESDIDLALILDGPDQPTAPIVVEMASDAFDVMLDTRVLVSPLAINRSVWNRPDLHTNPFLLANIRRDGIAL